MSIDFYVDPTTGDFVIENSDIRRTQSKIEYVIQKFTTRFKTLVGEWWWNVNYGGIDKDILFRKGITQAEADSWFIYQIRSFSEVTSIKTFESTYDKPNRSYSLYFVVTIDEEDVGVYIQSTRADSEIIYPEPTTFPININSNTTITQTDADALYEFVHITIPDYFD